MRKHSHWSGHAQAFFGGRGRAAEAPSTNDAAAFIQGALPDDWFTGPADVSVDRDEIIIVGSLPSPKLDEGATDADRAAAEQGRIAAFPGRLPERGSRSPASSSTATSARSPGVPSPVTPTSCSPRTPRR